MNETRIGMTVVMLTAVLAVRTWSEEIVASLDKNGILTCEGLQPNSTCAVEWASSLMDGFTNWASAVSHDAVAANSNGHISVSVPKYYRVRSVPVLPDGMVYVPAGVNSGTNPDLDLGPYTLTLSNALYVGKYEVTKSEWDKVYTWALTNGYSFDNTGAGKAANHPVQRVNWYDVVKWCNARSEKEGLTTCYYTDAAHSEVYRGGQLDLAFNSVDWMAAGYRLPTIWEWNTRRAGV